jgi:hypothetical protein
MKQVKAPVFFLAFQDTLPSDGTLWKVRGWTPEEVKEKAALSSQIRLRGRRIAGVLTFGEALDAGWRNKLRTAPWLLSGDRAGRIQLKTRTRVL